MTASMPSGLGPPGTGSCSTATDCLAAFLAADGQGSAVLACTDVRASGSSVPASGLPEGVVLSTACPAVARCWAAGVTDAEVSAAGMTIEAGATAWLADRQGGVAPDGVSLVASLSGLSTARCYAPAFAKPAGRGFVSVVLLSYGGD